MNRCRTSRAAAVAVVLMMATGCSIGFTTTDRTALDGLAAQVEALGSDVAELRGCLDDVTASVDGLATSQETLVADLSGFDSSVGELQDSVRELGNMEPSCPPPAPAIVAPVAARSVRTVSVRDDKILVGELERVWINPPGVIVVARVDTGASSSSLHAEEVVEFERDGDDWVRFRVFPDEGGEGGEGVEVERQVARHVRVYQQADRKGTRRPVVKMHVVLGNIEGAFDFTLADRSHLDNEVLLGRNFLTDVAVVDAGRRFVQEAHDPRMRDAGARR